MTYNQSQTTAAALNKYISDNHITQSEIQELLAAKEKEKLGKLARMIHPFPF